MARNVLQDLISLAEGAKAAEELVSRKDSLEQSCREAESRLRTIRDEESRAGASVAAAFDEATRVTTAAKKEAEKLVAAANRECAEKRATCDALCVDAVSTNEAVCAELQEKQDTLRDKIAGLEADESTLGQSIAALHAELDAIRAKLS